MRGDSGIHLFQQVGVDKRAFSNGTRHDSNSHYFLLRRRTIMPSVRWLASTVDVAVARFEQFSTEWKSTYPALIQSWERAWGEFVPFLEFPVELRKLVYTTNAIESLNARFRKAVRHRGHFPNEQAALKVLYLVATTKRANRTDLTGQINGWKQILNVLMMHYGERINHAI